MEDIRNYNKETYDEKQLKELITLSYKKLKSDVYYDNSNLFLREEIAKEENRIDDIINEVYKLLISEDNIKINKDEIDFYCLPKNIYKNNKKKKNIVCNDLSTSDYSINKVTYFIKMDLKYHILGTIWVILAGESLLKENNKYIYGRRLEKDLNYSNTRLFKPYHKEYSRWRDKAIFESEHLINTNTRNLMITLDIKDYYYSTNIDFNILNNDLKLKNLDRETDKNNFYLLKKITNHIEDVLDIYSSKIIQFDKNNKRNILPIGYMPSSILANWYLKDFDKSICNELRPIYYGRYIDDMIIVLPANYEKLNIDIEHIMNRYFINTKIFIPALCINEENNRSYILVKENNLYCIDINGKVEEIKKVADIKGIFIKIIDKTMNKDYEFRESISDLCKFDKYEDEWKVNIKSEINKLRKGDLILKLKKIIQECVIESNNFSRNYLLENKTKLTVNEYTSILAVQNAKIKIYDFHANGSKAVLEKFKKQIRENASVFKFLPEKDEVLNGFDEEVLEISYSEGINKIRSIEDFKINKYNLSKFLAQVIYSEKFDNEEYSNDLEEKILRLFSNVNIIEFHSLWEKALMCFIINDNKKYALKLIKNIEEEINKIDKNKVKLKDSNIYIHKKDNDISKKLIDSLKIHLKITIAMIWSLNDDLFFDEYKIYEDKTKLLELKDNLRTSNMLRHNYVLEPLFNYTNLVVNAKYKDRLKLNKLNLIKNQWGKDDLNFGLRCVGINNKNSVDCRYNNILELDSECVYELNSIAKKYTPRFVHLHEIILYMINKEMSQGKVVGGIKYIEKSIELYKKVNNLKIEKNNIVIKTLDEKDDYDKFISILSEHVNGGKGKYYKINERLSSQNESNINFIKIKSDTKLDKLKVAIVHMDVVDNDYKDSIMKTPNLDSRRLQRLYKILNQSIKNGSQMIIFPEISIPYSWLSLMANFSRKHNIAIVCGLEHIVYENNLACNYIATILPGKYNNYTHSIIKLRLKNHYAPFEIEMLNGYGLKIPVMNYKYIENKDGDFTKEYDLFRWNGVDFSCYNCFELSSLNDRGLFMSYVDLLVGSVHNRDINHYSNIIESLSRDVHCYFAQVNNSKNGDNRIVAPKSTIKKNILQITGGKNDTLLIGEIDIKKLREFQLKDYNLQQSDKSFKPTPPEFNRDVLKLRMNMPL